MLNGCLGNKPLTFHMPRNNVNFEAAPLLTLTQRNCVRKDGFPMKSLKFDSLRFKYRWDKEFVSVHLHTNLQFRI